MQKDSLGRIPGHFQSDALAWECCIGVTIKMAMETYENDSKSKLLYNIFLQ